MPNWTVEWDLVSEFVHVDILQKKPMKKETNPSPKMDRKFFILVWCYPPSTIVWSLICLWIFRVLFHFSIIIWHSCVKVSTGNDKNTSIRMHYLLLISLFFLRRNSVTFCLFIWILSRARAFCYHSQTLYLSLSLLFSFPSVFHRHLSCIVCMVASSISSRIQYIYIFFSFIPIYFFFRLFKRWFCVKTKLLFVTCSQFKPK